MGVRHVDSDEDARRLAGELNSPERKKPYVVVSTPAQRLRPYIDAEEVFGQVGDLAEVYLIHSGPETWAFSKAMPELTQVYGGAGRVYPVGTAWVTDPYRSPLRFAWSDAEGPHATGQLVADALRMAADAGLLNRSAARPTLIGGVVEGVFPPSRAIVRTDSRDLASVWQELLVADVPIERVLSEGMRVHGSFDPDTKRYDVREMLLPADECLTHYTVGDVVLAEVAEVAGDHAVLRLHPEVPVRVNRQDITSNELDLVSSLMTRGEVLSARVASLGPDWRLSMLDVDDDEEALQPPTLLRGGPPWLSPQLPTPVEPVTTEAPPLIVEPDTETEVSDEPLDRPPVQVPRQALGPRPTPALLDPRRRADAATLAAQITALRRELKKAETAHRISEQERAGLLRSLVDLRNERQLLHNELERARVENRRLAEQLRTSKTDLRKARQKAHVDRTGQEQGPLFLDAEEQFRHDVQVAWAVRIPAADKVNRPLAEYTLGPDFLRTVNEVEGINRSKVVGVVIEVLTGHAYGLDGRFMHPLRTSEAGDAPTVIRADGAKCWRVALQAKSPQARRMHFWRLGNGDIELSRVCLHDDFTP